MRLIAILSLLMLSVSAWAGTFKDDFEDGNWDGWEPFGGIFLNVVEEERFSVAEGVLQMDTTVGITDIAGYEMGVSLLRDWGNYSFSADVRIAKVDPGH
jgi:hypothetical protein